MTSVIIAAGMMSVIGLLLAQQAIIGAQIKNSAFVSQDIVAHHDLMRLQASNPEKCTMNFKGQRVDLTKVGANQPLSQAAVAPTDDFIKLNQTITSSGVSISQTSFKIDTVQVSGTDRIVYGNVAVTYTIPAQSKVIGSKGVVRPLVLRLITDSNGVVQSCGNSNLELNWKTCDADKVMVGVKATGEVECLEPPWSKKLNPLISFGCPSGQYVVSFSDSGAPNCGAPAVVASNQQQRCGANGCKDEIASCTQSGGRAVQEGGFVTCFDATTAAAPTIDSKGKCEAAGGRWTKVENKPPLKKGTHMECIR